MPVVIPVVAAAVAVDAIAGGVVAGAIGAGMAAETAAGFTLTNVATGATAGLADAIAAGTIGAAADGAIIGAGAGGLASAVTAGELATAATLGVVAASGGSSAAITDAVTSGIAAGNKLTPDIIDNLTTNVTSGTPIPSDVVAKAPSYTVFGGTVPFEQFEPAMMEAAKNGQLNQFLNANQESWNALQNIAQGDFKSGEFIWGSYSDALNANQAALSAPTQPSLPTGINTVQPNPFPSPVTPSATPSQLYWDSLSAQNQAAVEAAQSTLPSADTLTALDKSGLSQAEANMNALRNASIRNENIISYYQSLDPKTMLPAEQANLQGALKLQDQIISTMGKYEPLLPQGWTPTPAPVSEIMAPPEGFSGSITRAPSVVVPTPTPEPISGALSGGMGPGTVTGAELPAAIVPPVVTPPPAPVVTPTPPVTPPVVTPPVVTPPVVTPPVVTPPPPVLPPEPLPPPIEVPPAPPVAEVPPTVPKPPLSLVGDLSTVDMAKYGLLGAGALGLAALGGGSGGQQAAPATPTTTTTPTGLVAPPIQRTLTTPTGDLTQYGTGPEYKYYGALAAKGGYFDADQYFAEGGLAAPLNRPAMPTTSTFPTMAYTDGQGPVGTVAQPPGLSPSDSVGSDAPHASPVAVSPAAAAPGLQVESPLLAMRNLNASQVPAPVPQNPNVGYALGSSPLSALRM